ncbi:CopD family protein [Pseudomonas huanghezhanensis]|uniref:CopD family protein n=1 Tax=Pseudomonas huanghezhanensis TaxID=3002903 RepID=UPI0022864068|nr:CopD family protein [Pseudomonas sp. BSw22131]
MSPTALVYTLHVLAAMLWVGGMLFAWMILRPAVIASLEGPARLKLWLQVFSRFFVWVWAAVVMLPVTGIGIIQMNFSGFETAPRYVQVMIGLYVVMVALFIKIQSVQLPELRRAVAAEQWPDGVAALGKIRRLVGINLLVGIAVVCIASARPSF